MSNRNIIDYWKMPRGQFLVREYNCIGILLMLVLAVGRDEFFLYFCKVIQFDV